MWLGFITTILATVIIFALLQVFNYNHPSLAMISPFGKDPFKHIDYFHIADLPYMLAPAVFIVGLIAGTKLRNPSYKRERLAYQNTISELAKLRDLPAVRKRLGALRNRAGRKFKCLLRFKFKKFNSNRIPRAIK